MFKKLTLLLLSFVLILQTVISLTAVGNEYEPESEENTVEGVEDSFYELEYFADEEVDLEDLDEFEYSEDLTTFVRGELTAEKDYFEYSDDENTTAFHRFYDESRILFDAILDEHGPPLPPEHPDDWTAEEWEIVTAYFDANYNIINLVAANLFLLRDLIEYHGLDETQSTLLWQEFMYRNLEIFYIQEDIEQGFLTFEQAVERILANTAVLYGLLNESQIFIQEWEIIVDHLLYNNDMMNFVTINLFLLRDLILYHDLEDIDYYHFWQELMYRDTQMFYLRENMSDFTFEEIVELILENTAALFHLLNESQILIDTILDEYGPTSSWTDEEWDMFIALMSDFANIFSSAQFSLDSAYMIVHYFWLSYDKDLDILQMVLGISSEQFTPNCIREVEANMAGVIDVNAQFELVFEDIMSGLLSFEEAMVLTTAHKQAFSDFASALDAFLADIRINNPDASFRWTREEWDKFWDLESENSAVYARLGDKIAVAHFLLEADATTLESWFGSYADDALIQLADLVVRFYQTGDDFNVIIDKVFGNIPISFEMAAMLMIDNTNLFLEIESQLGEIFANHTHIWTYHEWESFVSLVETVEIWYNKTRSLYIFVNYLLEMDREAIKAEFGLNANDIMSLENMILQFNQGVSNLESAHGLGVLGLASFGEVNKLLITSWNDFYEFFNDFYELFAMPGDWQNDENWKSLMNLIEGYHEVISDLFSVVNFAETIIHYYHLGQKYGIDLVETILLLNITSEEIVALEALVVLANQVEGDFWLTFSLVHNNLLTFEVAAILINFNIEVALNLTEQFLAIIDASVLPPSDQPSAIDRLKQLLLEIEMLELNEADFTPESWALFALAHEKALAIVIIEDIIDIFAILTAYYDLRTAFEGLEKYLWEVDPEMPDLGDVDGMTPEMPVVTPEQSPTNPTTSGGGTGSNNNTDDGNQARPPLLQTGSVVVNTTLAGIALANFGVIVAIAKSKKR